MKAHPHPARITANIGAAPHATMAGCVLAAFLTAAFVLPLCTRSCSGIWTDAVCNAAGMAWGEQPASDSDSPDAATAGGAPGAAANVHELLQLPSMPSGCEIVSLACVLNSYGIPVSADALVEFLPRDESGDFVFSYAGDPYADSGIGYAPALTECAACFLGKNGIEAQAAPDSGMNAGKPMGPVDLTGTPFSRLCELVASGTPVMVWTTIDMEEPQISDPDAGVYSLVPNNHCVVLYGVSQIETSGTVQVMDPLEGLIDRNAEAFARIYEQRGCMALAFLPEGMAA